MSTLRSPLMRELNGLFTRFNDTDAKMGELSDNFWRNGGVCCPSCGVQGYASLEDQQERREKRIEEIKTKFEKHRRKTMPTLPFASPAENKLCTAITQALKLLNEGHSEANIELAANTLNEARIAYAKLGPSDSVVPWMPYMSDRADGVQGHYAIARMNPAGYREVWNLRTEEWSAFSDCVLTEEEAVAVLKTMRFAPNHMSKQFDKKK